MDGGAMLLYKRSGTGFGGIIIKSFILAARRRDDGAGVHMVLGVSE